jgi:hypothetical protein
MFAEIKRIVAVQFIVTAILALITYLLVCVVFHWQAPFAWSLLLTLFLINSVALSFFGRTADRNNPQVAIRNILAFFSVKLLAYLVVLLTFFVFFKAFKFQLAVLFLLYYVVYSVLNVWWLTKKNRANNQSKL